MSIREPQILSARAVVRARKRAARARFLAEFRREKAGVAGVVILVLFIALALLAPLLFSSDELKVTEAADPKAAADAIQKEIAQALG